MALFITLYFVLYGGCNAIVYRAFSLLLPAYSRWRIPLALTITLLVTAPFILRYLDRLGFTAIARIGTFLAWHWMAVAFWLGLLCGPLLVCHFAAHHIPALPPINHRRAMVFIGAIITVATLYAAWGATRIRLHRIALTAPANTLRTPIRIALISDLHFSLYRSTRLARRTAALIREAHPDLILSTGDMLDCRASEITAATAELAGLNLPAFGILGNHEWYTTLPESLAAYQAANITLLRGEQTQPRPDLRITGSDDPAGLHMPGATFHSAAEIPAFAGPKATFPRPYTIFLHHQPITPPAAAGRFDLQLSGHTHGGQIFPFGILVRARYGWLKGLHNLPTGGQIYITPGTGTWGPSLRLFARPEVTLIEITPSP